MGDAPAMRVLVVEDDEPMRAHLDRAVTAQDGLELIGSYGTFEEARALIEADPPEVLVTDLGLPDGSGLDLIWALKQRSRDALALVVTVMGDERSVIDAISRGASGYLLKDEPVEAIGPAIGALIGGGAPISPGIARYLLSRLRDDTERPDGGPALSERELEVLSMVAKGFRFGEIADILGISSHTVTTYVRRIYSKLDVSSKGEAVYEAIQMGILRLDD